MEKLNFIVGKYFESKHKQKLFALDINNNNNNSETNENC